MTVQTPEIVDLADLAGIDFPTPLLCDIDECHDDKIKARPAVALVVRTLPCCTASAPACEEHTEQARRCRDEHRAVMCFDHRLGMCSHLALRIEPLS